MANECEHNIGKCQQGSEHREDPEEAEMLASAKKRNEVTAHFVDMRKKR